MICLILHMKETMLQWTAFGSHFIFYFDRVSMCILPVTRKPPFVFATLSSNSAVVTFSTPISHPPHNYRQLISCPSLLQTKKTESKAKNWPISPMEISAPVQFVPPFDESPISICTTHLQPLRCTHISPTIVRAASLPLDTTESLPR